MRHILTSSAALFLALLIAGCTVGIDNGARIAYVDEHPELEVIHAEAIMNGQIMVGMTQEMVQAAWGKPSRVEDSIKSEDSAVTRWIYGNAFLGGNITDLFFDPDGTMIRYEVNSLQSHANSGVSASAGGDIARTHSGGGNATLTRDGASGRP